MFGESSKKSDDFLSQNPNLKHQYLQTRRAGELSIVANYFVRQKYHNDAVIIQNGGPHAHPCYLNFHRQHVCEGIGRIS